MFLQTDDKFKEVWFRRAKRTAQERLMFLHHESPVSKRKVKSIKVMKIFMCNSHHSFFLFVLKSLKTMVATIEISCCHICIAVDHSECFTCHNFSSSFGSESLPLSTQQAMICGICWNHCVNLIIPFLPLLQLLHIPSSSLAVSVGTCLSQFLENKVS